MNTSPPPLPWVDAWLADVLRSARGHAVLLHGPRGIGQFELARRLAATWLCEGDASTGACGHCASCRLVAARTHPDLRVVLPEALRVELGWEGEDEEGAEKTSKAKPSKEIKVDAVRGVVAFAQTTSARGRGKVVVLHPAERMNGIAANTLLKTLEEPPPGLRFVLSCAAPEQLLPTIRSRCQAQALPLPPGDAASAWLAAQGVAEAPLLLAASGGQPLDALQSAADGLDAALWRRLPGLVRGGEAAPLAVLPLPRLVDALQKFCHDLQRSLAGAAPRYLPADLLPAVDDAAALAAWGLALQAAARHAEHPVQAALAAESLILQGRRAFFGARRGLQPPARSLHSVG
jgi:DNA polymerase-3 subunit delta'